MRNLLIFFGRSHEDFVKKMAKWLMKKPREDLLEIYKRF